MRSRLLKAVAALLLVLVALVAFDFGASWWRARPSGDLEQMLSAEQLNEDLSSMLETFEQVHPDLYAGSSRQTFDLAVGKLQERFAQPRTLRQAHLDLAELVALLGDAHTYLSLPDRWRDEREGARFPLRLQRQGERLLVAARAPHLDSVELGDELLEIDGRPVSELWADAIRRTSGPTDYRRSRVEASFETWLWLLEIEPPFELRLVRADSGEAYGVVTGAAETESATGVSASSYELRWPADGVALIDYRSMRNDDDMSFEQFLRRSFTEIDEKGALGLIVDLRQNGGGNSSIGEQLLSYISDKPYRLASQKLYRASRQHLAFTKRRLVPTGLRWLPLQYLDSSMRRVRAAGIGGMVTLGGLELETPPENPLRFSGPVCVLIGGRTFSSATMLADAIRTFDLATVVGEETGGEANHFGEIYLFRLPNSRLRVSVSSSRFLGAAGDESQRGGVQPHIVVETTAEDVRAGRDPVLERALQVIRGATDDSLTAVR